MKIHRSPALPILIASIAMVLSTSGFCFGQLAYERHALIRGDMPPGLAADAARLSNPELNHHLQPVRLIVPDEARIEVGSNGAYTDSFSSRTTVGMKVGPVYRFKVTSIPRNFGKELYPSIEILDKLNPPPGLENEFPIQINISQDDLEQALEGRMVTKVIYLENPNTALPHRHVEDHQPSFDVGGNADPLRAAERLGRPMAIMRMGSRIPTHDYEDSGFGFYSPSPQLLGAAPMITETEPDWNQVERQTVPGHFESAVTREPVQVPARVVPDSKPIRVPDSPIRIPPQNFPPVVLERVVPAESGN